MVKEHTVMVDDEADWAWMGTLINGSRLVNATKIDVDWVGEYNCMNILRIPKADQEVGQESLFLPVKVVMDLRGQRILVKPSKMLYFNRVAKTGSQSFTHLFVKLGPKLGKHTIAS